MQAVPGHAQGLRQPGLLAWLEFRSAVSAVPVWPPLQAALAPHLPPQVDTQDRHGLVQRIAPPLPQGLLTALDSLASSVAWLQESAGLPVMDDALVIQAGCSSDQPQTVRCLLLCPTLAPQAAARALTWVVQVLGDWRDAPAPTGLSAARQDELAALLADLQPLAPRGSNNRHLLRAAHQLGMPTAMLPMGVIQYGWGRRARWMESTFTDATPNISARLARNKPATAALLRLAGLPVPEQAQVQHLEPALEAAQRLGYPVVVKPADRDGGVGVSAGLMDENELRAAFARARQFSDNILVEKHVPGHDYRVYVFNGQMVWAMERIPAGVTGDGVSTIQSLLDEANRDPRRGNQPWAQMTPITLNDEALELLTAAGLTPAAIPPAGAFVRLRRASNVSSGGTPVAVMHRIHPDNARLAERAANALRLDLAGIDVLMPDIGTSWLETGAGICEVNGQPQLSLTSPHIQAQILGELVPGDGRIPVVVMLSSRDPAPLLASLAERLVPQGLTLGFSTSGGLQMGAHAVRRGRHSAFDDARALLVNPVVDAVLIATDGREWLRSGLPFDRFDLMVLDDSPPEELASVLALLRAHCTQGVLFPAHHAAEALLGRMVNASALYRLPAAHVGPEPLAQAILQCDALHRSKTPLARDASEKRGTSL